MLPYEEIQMLFQKHSYIMRTSELRAAKIYYEDIQSLLSEGAIEKVKRGYYLWSDQENASEIVMIKRLFPDAILCMYTALFHYGYSDRTPSEWHFAVDKNIAKYRIKIDYPFIKTYFFEPHVLDIGKTTDKIDGVNISIYDKDRTICDCLRYMNKMDKEIFNKAIQSYVNDPDKSIPNLMRYAKELRVQSKVKNLIGVWL